MIIKTPAVTGRFNFLLYGMFIFYLIKYAALWLKTRRGQVPTAGRKQQFLFRGRHLHYQVTGITG